VLSKGDLPFAADFYAASLVAPWSFAQRGVSRLLPTVWTLNQHTLPAAHAHVWVQLTRFL